jgi:para-nitrobenzyl esterase
MQSLPGGFPAITSEDCLNLNIWAPIQNVSLPMNETASKLPVMVFIYGGSFQSGAGFLYDSTQLAATGNVIVVTINYRLGAFGFLASDALQRANSLNSTGNYGLQDQRAAFQWVQRNIAQFGGDASRVTVFGESAGAISTCHHLVSPHSAGLFSAALLESGLCDARTMDVAINNFTTVFLKALNCSDDVSCLQNKTADEIFAAQRKVPSAVVAGILAWGPVVDGYELKMLPKEYLGNGSFSRVPVVAGTNLNEYSYFLCGSSTINITKEQSTDFLITVFGKHQADEIVRLYGFESYSSPVQLLIGTPSPASSHV